MMEPSRAELKYQIERQKEEIKTVNEVGRLISSTFDPTQIIRLVAGYLKQAYPIAMCSVLLFESRKLHLVRFAPISEMGMTNAIAQLLKGAGEYTPEPLKPEELEFLVENPSAGNGQWAQVAIGVLRSHLAVPLKFDQQTVGLLGIFSAQEKGISQQDAHTFEIVAGQLRSGLRTALLLEQLKEADRMKNDLLSIISHELRIPLTVIQEGVNLLDEGALGEINKDQKEFLGTIDQNVKRLKRLMDKVLMATQVITGSLECRYVLTDLVALLTEVKETFQSMAEAKGVSLDLVGASQVNSWMVDPEKLKQALGQMVENAIQSTPAKGRVAVSMVVLGSQVELQVEDTGTGIPEEDLEGIFDQFRSVGGIHDRKTGGLGLGLFTAKSLVQLHEGTVVLSSQVGKGTKVIVRLPKREEGQELSGKAE